MCQSTSQQRGTAQHIMMQQFTTEHGKELQFTS
jgi:hypothetical protein